MRDLRGLRAGVSRAALLGGAAPLLVGITLANAAHAQVTISGSVTTNQNLDTLCGCTSPSTATITSTGSIATGASVAVVGTINAWSILNQGSVSGSRGIQLANQAGTVTNAGTIAGSGAAARGIELLAGGMVTNQSGGVISLDSNTN